jgi:hypothetical protein
MILCKNKNIFLVFAVLITPFNQLLCSTQELIIVGGGIAGGMEAYYAHIDAKIDKKKKKNKAPLRITIYEKNDSIKATTVSNIVPSLTCDEILSVVPRGPELVKKLEVLFSNPGGIRVADVRGIHDTEVTEYFKQEVQTYSLDEVGHKQRTQDLLALGKMSMDLWKEIYNTADAEFKKILELSNFNPCCEPSNATHKVLHDGYRIDLIYNIPNAEERAANMKQDYETLGYKHCAILTPAEVMAIDPFLTDFCKKHSVDNVWNDDTVALWRPGGCLDAQVFLPMLYEYLKKAMGTYTNEQGQQEDCFQIHYGKKVIGLEFAKNSTGNAVIAGLQFEDGQTIIKDTTRCHYVFCPGEAVGTLKKLGLSEPAYAGFAGVSLMLDIEIPQDKLKDYASFSHCMEVHQEGIVLAWQARFRNNKIFIGVAGTKAFYSDQQPTKDQEFARNRNLLQLNMVNDVLPEFISLALGYDTKEKALTEKDLDYLESQKIATRWAGVRAVVYDGFPSLGYVYKENTKIENARCTTHLGSGGGSFSPAATIISRSAMNKEQDAFAQRILNYGNPSRTSKSL